MNIIGIINKKRNNEVLTKEEISYFITGYVNDEIKDYQISSLLMAICINGMNIEETYNLTMSMVHSGDVIDLSEFNNNICDKHSTGGVGDKTTLLLLPLVASCGVNIAKMSGRGLGITGGTVDKLESIPGFVIEQTDKKMKKQIHDINVAITSQTGNITPADKKIYKLRDVSGTVASIPLIASSIMSKKIASGSKNLVIDVKLGSGAFMRTMDEALALSKTMIEIAKRAGIKITCFITNMDIPLGSNIGNSLEVLEVIDILTKKTINNLSLLSIELASKMVSMALEIDIKKAKTMIIENFNNDKALDKFYELIKYQKGDIKEIKSSKYVNGIKSIKSGYINKIDAYHLGSLGIDIKMNRLQKEDSIDYNAGFVLKKQLGDYVNIDDIIIEVHTEQDINDELKNKVLEAFEFSDEKINADLIYEILESN